MMATAATELAFKLSMFQATYETYRHEIHLFPFLRLELRQLARQFPHLTLTDVSRRLERFEDLTAAALGTVARPVPSPRPSTGASRKPAHVTISRDGFSSAH